MSAHIANISTTPSNFIGGIAGADFGDRAAVFRIVVTKLETSTFTLESVLNDNRFHGNGCHTITERVLVRVSSTRDSSFVMVEVPVRMANLLYLIRLSTYLAASLVL